MLLARRRTKERDLHFARGDRTAIFTMKTTSIALVLIAVLRTAAAAPALVWRSGVDSSQSSYVVHTSEAVQAADVLEQAIVASDSENLQVLFLLGRSADGSETLSTLASDGSLPGVADKYSSAQSVHHNVAGMEGPSTLVHRVSELRPNSRALQVSLTEFTSKLADLHNSNEEEMQVHADGAMSKSAKANNNKRARALADANVLVVHVDAASTTAAEIDSAVVSAIESNKVDSVVLSAVRSHDEVKHERDMMARNRFLAQKAAGERLLDQRRRRLDEQDGGDGGGNNNNQDTAGVYFVQMTPNILAGILFFFMFAFCTWLGITCMGMISGQTVYVNKMPAIGREA